MKPIFNIRYLIVITIVLVWVAIGIGAVVNGAADSVGATVTAQSVSVTVEDGVVAYSTVATSGTSDTLAGDLNDIQHAGNTGNVNIDLTINGMNSTSAGAGWTLADAAASETYAHKFSTDAGVAWIALATSAKNLDTALAAAQTQDFDLRIYTPTATTDYNEQTVDVTITSSASS